MLQTMDRFLDWLATRSLAWWAWPATLVALALVSDALALFFQPLGAEWVAWPWGGKLGDTCEMIVRTGMPCPQCGMTRSWVHAARGAWVDAFWFSPAGMTLFLWINAGGIVGLIRLVRRAPRAIEPPAWLLVGWVALWFCVLYVGAYALRVAGYNPLP